MFIRKILQCYRTFLENRINIGNMERLANYDFTIVASNCAGGILYHWLGLKFQSPFINLWFENNDFVKMLEHFEEFLSTPIVQYNDDTKDYPVGIGYDGIKIYFMHYKNFEEALECWNKRKQRINMNNVCIMFTNYSGGGYGILQRFDNLPFKNKVVFVDRPYPEIKSAVYLKGWHPWKNGKPCNVWQTQNYFTGKRYIDQFDYVEFFNRCKK